MKRILLFIFSLCFLPIGIQAQVGIGTTTPNASSVLDISATDKGVLIPKVSLLDVSDTMLDGVNTAATGLLIYNTNAGTTGGSGVGYYYFNGTIWERLLTSTTPSGDDHDFYEEGTTTSPDNINDDKFTFGNIAVGKNTADYPLEINSTLANRTLNLYNATTTGVTSGIYNEVGGNMTTATFQRGMYNLLNGSGNNPHFGVYNSLNGSGSSFHMGTYNLLSGAGTGEQRGVVNVISNSGDDFHYGIYNQLDGSGTGQHYGNATFISGTGSGFQYGTYNNLGGTGVGRMYGTTNIIVNTSDNIHYGVVNSLTGSGTGPKYGTHTTILPSAGGTHYGVFSNVLKAGSFAGYFLGTVSIGTTTLNNYTFPATRGTANQVMQTDATGNVDWVDASAVGGDDHDFYEEGTTTAPDDINDDQFTMGNLAIGKNTADWPIDIENSISERGVSVLLNGANNDLKFGNRIEISNTGSGYHYGSYNTLSGMGTGRQYGIYNFIDNSGAENHYGSYNFLSGTGTGIQYGALNFVDNSGNGLHYGNWTRLQGAGIGQQTGNYINITNSGNATHYGEFIRLEGNGTGTHNGSEIQLSGSGSGAQLGTINVIDNSGNGLHYGSYNVLSGTGTGTHYGNWARLQGAGAGTQIGSYNAILNSGNGDHKGIENQLSGNGSGTKTGIDNTVTSNGDGEHIGSYNGLWGTGNGSQYGVKNYFFNNGSTNTQYGFYNEIYSQGDGHHYGVYSTLSGNGNGNKYGIYNQISGGGTGVKYGLFTQLAGAGTGDQYAMRNFITNSGDGNHYGNHLALNGTGSGTKYGSHITINPAAGGNHYGVYSSALKVGSFAGYFLGNVSIGTTIANSYILPASRGTNGQIMQTDGAGNVSWVNNPSASFWSRTGTVLSLVNAGDDITFVDDQTSITFPNTNGTPSSMIYMFQGAGNVDRMVLSHSAAFPDWGLEYEDTTDSFIFKSSTQERVEIDLAGGFPLRVYGTARAQNFQSDTTTYPDYVFESYFQGYSNLNSDYSFKTLAEVESFILENGHLPNVKSYQEVKDEGMTINVGEMTVTNLEKIEELFLYEIETNKKMESLSEENIAKLSRQEKKIENLEKELNNLKQKLNILLQKKE